VPTPNRVLFSPTLPARVGQRACFALVAVLTAAGAGYAQTTLELPLETGGNAPAKAAPKPATPKPTPTRGRTGGGSRMTALPLPSRGSSGRAAVRQAPKPAPKVLAQLGLVVADKLEVRVSQDPASQVLSAVEKGTHLAVVQETELYWGVLMVNNTVGWVPKATLELIDYRTEVSVPQPKAEEPKAQSPQEQLTEGLTQVQQALLRESFTYLGVPYVWAGNTRNGLDCSAFVKNVFATVGVSLPRHSGDQARVGIPVQGPDLRPGDRLYFDMKRSGRVNHTGIYIGNGLFIHASSNQRKVGVDSIFKKGYYNGLVAARRDFE
jgi:cell wall-associated NlpC family hydrolase